jgi:hypothetical protein
MDMKTHHAPAREKENRMQASRSGLSLCLALALVGLGMHVQSAAASTPESSATAAQPSEVIAQAALLGKQQFSLGGVREQGETDSQALQRLRQAAMQQVKVQGTVVAPQQASPVPDAQTQQAVQKAPASNAAVPARVQTKVGKTRAAIISANRLSLPSKDQGVASGVTVYYDFAIYDAHARLFDDIDRDGFYRTFSVTFDADVYGLSALDHADVYAELYLSRNGGPWVHYYTTDIFAIQGATSLDDYEVLTTLYSGYPTDFYDVLVDLYEVGYSDIVATISSDDTDALYALPLESADYDTVQTHVDTHVEVSGGALSSVPSLLALLAWVRVRRSRR